MWGPGVEPVTAGPEPIVHLAGTERESPAARVGLVVRPLPGSSTSVVGRVALAEGVGVRRVWATQGPAAADALILFSGAAAVTGEIGFGTAVLPIVPRHPLELARAASAFELIAPGRLRLGLGTSHRQISEDVYGFSPPNPMEQLREYTAVLRQALWTGTVDVRGTYFHAVADLGAAPRTPLMLAALGERAFALAGEIGDGAISWLCPVSYLQEVALPALTAGAAASDRLRPPLVAHVLVATSANRPAVVAAAGRRVLYNARLRSYARMFAAAGLPVDVDGSGVDALAADLVVSGRDDEIAERLSTLLAGGLDELMLELVPVEHPDDEWARLARLVGGLR